MKKIGDLLTALGIVGFIAVILELVVGWKMIPQSIILWFIMGSILLLIIGVILRVGLGNAADKGKDMKQIGIGSIVFGAILLLITFAGMFSNNGSSEKSTLVQFVESRFPFLIIFGLLLLLVGIILRSVGKTKETKNAKKEE